MAQRSAMQQFVLMCILSSAPIASCLSVNVGPPPSKNHNVNDDSDMLQDFLLSWVGGASAEDEGEESEDMLKKDSDNLPSDPQLVDAAGGRRVPPKLKCKPWCAKMRDYEWFEKCHGKEWFNSCGACPECLTLAPADGGTNSNNEVHPWDNFWWPGWIAPDATWPGADTYPLARRSQCTDADMEYYFTLAERAARNRWRFEERFVLDCFWENWGGQTVGLAVKEWATCFQGWYPGLSLECTECVGAVHNMAIANMTGSCMNSCYGKGPAKAGGLWCTKPCKDCMSYVGSKYSVCLGGHRWDMVCEQQEIIKRKKYWREWRENHGQ